MAARAINAPPPVLEHTWTKKRTPSKAAAADDETQKSGVFLVGPFAWTLLAKPHPLPLAEVRRNNSEREGGGEKGAGSPQLGRTNSWARVAAAAVATR